MEYCVLLPGIISLRFDNPKVKVKRMRTKTITLGISRGFTLIEIMIVVAIIGILAAIAIPNFVRARLQAQRTTCISNLQQLDGAKQTWALENKASPSTVPVLANIKPYMGRGTAGTAPSCPADPASTFPTSYALNDLNTTPSCIILPGAVSDTTGHHLDN